MSNTNTDKKEKSKFSKWIYLVLFVVAIILVLAIVAKPNLTKPLLDRRGWLGDTYFFDGDRGPVALSVAYHITESTTTARQGSRTEQSIYSWIVSIDLSSGDRLARTEFKNKSDFRKIDAARFLGHTETFIWTINEGDGLHGRDPYSGEITLPQSEIETANPGISLPSFYQTSGQDMGKISNYAYDTISQGIFVKISDDEFVLIDPDTFEARPSSLEDIEPRIGIRRGEGSIRDTGIYKFRRESIFYVKGFYRVRLNPGWLVHRGTFIVDEVTDDYLRDSNPDSFFITYTEDYSEDARILFARVRNDGFPIWATDLGFTTEIAAMRNGDIYAMAGGVLYNLN